MPTKSSKQLTEAPLAAPQEESDHATASDATEPLPPVLFRVQGPMSTFGGPRDRDMGAAEGLALFGPEDLKDPRHKSLFLPSQPPGTSGLGRRLNPDK